MEKEILNNSAQYPLIDSCITIADSFVRDLKIYYTHIKDVWLSEINFIDGSSMKDKDLLQLVYRKDGKISTSAISNEIVLHSDTATVQLYIDEFYREILV